MSNAKVVSFQRNNNDTLYDYKFNEIAEEKRKEQIRRDLTKGYLSMLSNYYAN